MFRIPASPEGKQNSCRDPAKTDVWTPLSSQCRSQASGMPSKMAAAAADMHRFYHYLTRYAKKFGASPQVSGVGLRSLNRDGLAAARPPVGSGRRFPS